VSKLDLTFSGPGAAPETLDARKSLAVALAYVETLNSVARYDWIYEDAPFIVTLTNITVGSCKYHLGHQIVSGRVPKPDAEKSWNAVPDRVEVYAGSGHQAPRDVRAKILRLFAATRALPEKIEATVRRESDGWAWSVSTASQVAPAPSRTSLSKFRAVVVKVGGKRPRIQLAYKGETSTFSLPASTEIVQRAGKWLYQPVNVTARITRLMTPPHYPVVNGEIQDIQPLSRESPVTAFDRWYAESGRPLLSTDDIDSHDGAGLISHG
jgi:hypothetical protein